MYEFKIPFLLQIELDSAFFSELENFKCNTQIETSL